MHWVSRKNVVSSLRVPQAQWHPSHCLIANAVEDSKNHSSIITSCGGNAHRNHKYPSPEAVVAAIGVDAFLLAPSGPDYYGDQVEKAGPSDFLPALLAPGQNGLGDHFPSQETYPLPLFTKRVGLLAVEIFSGLSQVSLDVFCRIRGNSLEWRAKISLEL